MNKKIKLSLAISALAGLVFFTGCQKEYPSAIPAALAQTYGYMDVPAPLKTCLFFNFNGAIRDSWSYFASNSSDAYRSTCLSSIARGGGNCVVVLLSNGDPNAPVSFWKDSYGQTPDMDKLALLVQQAKAIHDAGGALIPCFFCDDSASSHIRNVDMQTHARAIGLFVTLLRPYCPAFIIGLESSEYFSTARHNEFYTLIKYLAPDRFVLVHMQGIPQDGMPLCDAWAFEASWNPNNGDEYSGSDLVEECKTAASASGKLIWPLEYNVNVNGSKIIEQSKAVLAAGFPGCGGPIK